MGGGSNRRATGSIVLICIPSHKLKALQLTESTFFGKYFMTDHLSTSSSLQEARQWARLAE